MRCNIGLELKKAAPTLLLKINCTVSYLSIRTWIHQQEKLNKIIREEVRLRHLDNADGQQQIIVHITQKQTTVKHTPSTNHTLDQNECIFLTIKITFI